MPRYLALLFCFLSATVGISAGTALPNPGTAPEWTMEAARKRWKPLVRPVTHVGVPGYQFQTSVLWDGALVFGPVHFLQLKVMQKETAPLGDRLLHLSVGFGEEMRLVDRTGTGSGAITRRLEEGRLPIPHVQTADSDLVWDEAVYAHLLGRKMEEGMKPRPDDMLVTRVVFTVRNTGVARRVGHLWLHFGTTARVKLGYKCRQEPDLAPTIAHRYEAPYGGMDGKVRYVLPAPSSGEMVWHEALPVLDGMKTAPERVLEWRVPLSPGEERRLQLTIPYGLLERTTAEALVSLDAENAKKEVRTFWSKLIHGPGQIITPDPFINDFLAAVPGHMAQQVAYRTHTNVWMYKTSPNFYEGYWPVCAAKALPTFALRGLPHISEPVMKSFVDFQKSGPDGMTRSGMKVNERGERVGERVGGEGFSDHPGFLSDFGEWYANPMIWGHGLELWDLAAHFRITRNKVWLGKGRGSPLQAILDGCDWIAHQRRRTMREENGQRVPYWGQLPAASTHDWLAGNVVINDAYSIYGMAETVRLLREIRHPRAEEWAKELADYRDCLRTNFRAARDKARRLPLPDGSSIPFVPRAVQELDWAKVDWTYTDFAVARAGGLGAFDPDDELITQALAFVEAGMPRGEGHYVTAHRNWYSPDNGDAIWADVADPLAERHYLGRHHVDYENNWPMFEVFLGRDDLPRFFECMFNNMAVVHADWRSGMESLDGVPACAPFEGERWRMIRAMFVNERGGYDGSSQSLWLLQALPRSWLRPGYSLAARRIGTHLGGAIDLELRVSDDGNSVSVSANIDNLAVRPREIVMRLRSGDGRPLVAAEVNGRKSSVRAGDTIALPVQSAGRYQIVGRFE